MPEIGETLRETRMRRRIDMTEVEAATKIRAKYLRALENEEWDLLPGPTFVKTFLRTYAEYLDLDPRLLVEEYRQRYERPSGSDMTPFGPGLGGSRQRRRQRRRPIGPILVVVIGIAVLLGALYAIGQLGGKGNNEPLPPTASITPTATASPTPPSHKKAKKKHKKAVPTRVNLRIKTTKPVFVCLVDATGKTLIDGQNLDTGYTSKTFRSQRFRMNLGNGGVTMIYGGKSYPASDTGAPIGYEVRAGHKPKRLAESVRIKLCA
jgi:cytoskeleton protein RodZ